MNAEGQYDIMAQSAQGLPKFTLRQPGHDTGPPKWWALLVSFDAQLHQGGHMAHGQSPAAAATMPEAPLAIREY
jgi:hypothetical protein